jgi:hypothetical protein
VNKDLGPIEVDMKLQVKGRDTKYNCIVEMALSLGQKFWIQVLLFAFYEYLKVTDVLPPW